jgi:hypothetical protein
MLHEQLDFLPLFWWGLCYSFFSVLLVLFCSVSNVAVISGLSKLDCTFGFLERLSKNNYYRRWKDFCLPFLLIFQLYHGWNKLRRV